jgi:hypothetical protein
MAMTKKKHFVAEVHDDRTKVRLTMGKEELTLDAAEMDTLIMELGKRRQMLADSVPMQLDPHARIPEFVFQSPVMIGRPGEAKFGFIGLRHPGFGWMAYAFPPHELRAIRDVADQVAKTIDPIEMPRNPSIIMPGS